MYEIESEDGVIIGGRPTPLDISSYAIDLVDGAQCKCKRKPLFFPCVRSTPFRYMDIVNADCLCFGSVSAIPLVSSSSSQRKSFSVREGSVNLAVPIRKANSCDCKRKC